MDQIKVGRFIASMRKARGMTQRQLADSLHISDKTVSKWECGHGLPEVGLMLPLCETLEISVNELLSGMRLDMADYPKRAEENMMDLMREREEAKKKLRVSVVVGVMGTAVFVFLLLLVAFYAEMFAPGMKVFIILFACLVFAVGIYTAMYLELEAGYFACKHCGHRFKASWGAYLMGMHVLRTRYLKCPVCGKKSWCNYVLGKEESGTET